MIDAKIKVIFYCYLDDEGMQKQVLKPDDDEREDLSVEEQEAVDTLKQPLSMSGTEHGIYTGREIAGKISLHKEALHDLLNAEGLGQRALFVVEVS